MSSVGSACLTLLLLLGGIMANGQTTETAERLADEIFAQPDEDLSYEALYENMMQWLQHPLDINRASAEQLRSLHILSEQQVRALILYRQQQGDLIAPYELQVIPSFDRTTIDRLLPLIQIRDTTSSVSSLVHAIRYDQLNYLLIRTDRVIEQAKGYRADSTARYQGSPNRYYLRFRSSKSNRFSIGLTLEQDAGEVWAWRPSRKQYGTDFVSGHMQLMNRGALKNLIIGDFTSQFGQGLSLGGGFGFGKGAETVLTVRRSNLGFLPYTSANESGYLHGAACTWALSRSLWLSSFFSSAYRDGVVSSDSTEQTFVSSFPLAGLHRNERELASRKQVRQHDWGGVLQYRQSHWEVGLLVTRTTLGQPLQPSASVYKAFDFRGSERTQLGLFYQADLHHVSLFGEFSQSLHAGYGWVMGLQTHLTDRFEIAVHVRQYQRNYQTFYTSAFAESSTPRNEQGIYTGWKYKINRKINLASYLDLFRFPWIRYRLYKPSEGYEWLFRINYLPTRKIQLAAQFREEVKDRNLSDVTTTYQVASGTRRNVMMHLNFAASTAWKFKTRVQFSEWQFGGKRSKGLALIQDTQWSYRKLTLTVRHALFDTDDFDTRQYVYENDVWLGYSMPAYNGTGIRHVLMVQYDFTKTITGWIRWGRYQYEKVDKIGSAGDTIDGNIRNDLKFQLRIRF